MPHEEVKSGAWGVFTSWPFRRCCVFCFWCPRHFCQQDPSWQSFVQDTKAHLRSLQLQCACKESAKRKGWWCHWKGEDICVLCFFLSTLCALTEWWEHLKLQASEVKLVYTDEKKSCRHIFVSFGESKWLRMHWTLGSVEDQHWWIRIKWDHQGRIWPTLICSSSIESSPQK